MVKHLYDAFSSWYQGGRIFIYSDPHFSDLDSYKFRFPEVFKETDITKMLLNKLLGEEKAASWVDDCVKELDQMQIDRINKVCTKQDSIIILGDVGNVECIKKLKAGYKVLILGNHDAGAGNYKKTESFTENETGKLVNPKNKFVTIDGKRFEYETNGLFDEVYSGPLFVAEKILLSHEPIEFGFALNIHGHVHNKNYISSGINVCAECIDYTPVCLNELIKSGVLKNIKDIHRQTIDKATEKKKHCQNKTKNIC